MSVPWLIEYEHKLLPVDASDPAWHRRVDPSQFRTIESLWELPDVPGRFDLLNGRLVQNLPAYGSHGFLAGRLCWRVCSYIDEHKLGHMSAVGTGVVLARNPDTLVQPELLVVRKENHPPESELQDFLQRPPDLAVDFHATTDDRDNFDEKIEEYLKAKTPLLWTVDLVRERVGIYSHGEAAATLTYHGELDGGDLLPGLRVSIAELIHR